MGDFLYPGDIAALTLLSTSSAGMSIYTPIRGGSPTPGTGGTGGATDCGCCPTGWFTEVEDVLRLSVEVKGGPKTVRFGGRHRAKDGTIVRLGEDLTNNDPAVPTVKYLHMTDGCLLGVGASVTDSLGSAVVCVVAELGVIEAGIFTPYATVYAGILTQCGTIPKTMSVPDPQSVDIISASVVFDVSGATPFGDIPAPPPGYLMRVTNVFATISTTLATGPTHYRFTVSGTGGAPWTVDFTPDVPAGLGTVTLEASVNSSPGNFAPANTAWVATLPYPINFSEGITIFLEETSAFTGQTYSFANAQYEYVKGFN